MLPRLSTVVHIKFFSVFILWALFPLGLVWCLRTNILNHCSKESLVRSSYVPKSPRSGTYNIFFAFYLQSNSFLRLGFLDATRFIYLLITAKIHPWYAVYMFPRLFTSVHIIFFSRFIFWAIFPLTLISWCPPDKLLTNYCLKEPLPHSPHGTTPPLTRTYHILSAIHLASIFSFESTISWCLPTNILD